MSGRLLRSGDRPPRNVTALLRRLDPIADRGDEQACYVRVRTEARVRRGDLDGLGDWLRETVERIEARTARTRGRREPEEARR